jgi:putative membrane protein
MIKYIINRLEKRIPTKIYDFSKEDMILRDFLALDRTILANERTFLAWFRTSLSLIAAGIAVVKLNIDLMFFIGGLCLIAMGIPIGIIGFIRYSRMNKRLEQIKF